jgi:hypothetical protein
VRREATLVTFDRRLEDGFVPARDPAPTFFSLSART